MQDLTGKITGGTLTAAEWNQLPQEVQNVIVDNGITLSNGDLDQLGDAIANYAHSGLYYTAAGTNTITLTKVGAKRGLERLAAITDGALVIFRPANANTGATTVNVNGLGAKDVRRETDAVLAAGDLTTGRDAILRYEQSTDRFHLLDGSRALDAVLARGYIDGLICSIGTDTDHDIDIAEGAARSDDDTVDLVLAAGLTREIDGAWGTGNGGFPSGLTLSADTWYHVFLIRNTSTGAIDAGFDTSLTAANLLADATGYANPRRIGSVLTDGSENLIPFVQAGNEFLWDVPVQDVNGVAASNTAALETVSTPLGVVCGHIGRWLISDTGAASGDFGCLVTSPLVADTAPSYPGFVTVGIDTGLQNDDSAVLTVPTDTSSQIRHREAGSLPNVAIDVWALTYGWVDRRGKDA